MSESDNFNGVLSRIPSKSGSAVVLRHESRKSKNKNNPGFFSKKFPEKHALISFLWFPEAGCSRTEFICSDATCVSFTKRCSCDGVQDCLDGSDEKQCPGKNIPVFAMTNFDI